MNKYIIIVQFIIIILLSYFCIKKYNSNEYPDDPVFGAQQVYLKLLYSSLAHEDKILTEVQKKQYIADLFRFYLLFPQSVHDHDSLSFYALDFSYAKYVNDPLAWKTSKENSHSNIVWKKIACQVQSAGETYSLLRLEKKGPPSEVRFYDLLWVSETLSTDLTDNEQERYNVLSGKFKNQIKWKE